jgi:hypothetical protein
MIKERVGDIFIRILCMEKHNVFFIKNPFVNEICTIENDFARRNRGTKRFNLYKNEINMWCMMPEKDPDAADIPWSSARNINEFFKSKIITKEDNLLPELYYTQEERESVSNFIDENSPYVIIETESFSGQCMYNARTIMDRLSERIQNNKYKLFTSAFSTDIKHPFYSLNNFDLRQAGLLIESSKAFYGISSGMTVVSFEKTLKEPPIRIFAGAKCWYDSMCRYDNAKNTINIDSKNYIDYVSDDINKL